MAKHSNKSTNPPNSETSKIELLKKQLSEFESLDSSAIEKHIEEEHSRASLEVAALEGEIIEAERLERRDADVAEVLQLQNELDSACRDFDRIVSGVYEVWQNVLRHLGEADAIVAFLRRARELGALQDAPPALQGIHVPDSDLIEAEFRTTDGGLNGLEWFQQRIRQERYFKAPASWFYANGFPG